MTYPRIKAVLDIAGMLGIVYAYGVAGALECDRIGLTAGIIRIAAGTALGCLCLWISGQIRALERMEYYLGIMDGYMELADRYGESIQSGGGNGALSAPERTDTPCEDTGWPDVELPF